MCWNKEISLTLEILGTFCTLDQYTRYKSGNFKYFSTVLIYALYTSMEWFQFSQHVHGFEGCDSMNEKLTLLAHFLLWIQPITINFHAYSCCKKQDKSLYKYAVFACFVAGIVSTISLYIGYQKSIKGIFPLSQEDLNNVGNQLCTKKDHIHFSWYFPYDSLQGYRPLGFTWIILAGFPNFFMNGKLNAKNWFGTGWLFGVFCLMGWLVAAYFVGSFSSPLWSFWCLTSFFYLIVPYIYWLFIHPFAPKSWFENYDEEELEKEKITKKHK